MWKVKPTVIIAILLIATRTLMYFSIQGVHSFKYYLKLSNIKDIITYSCIAYLLHLNSYKIKPPFKRIINYYYWYTASFSIVMLYPFLPNEYSDQKYSTPMLVTFNGIWLTLSGCLIIYYMFYRKNKVA